MVYTDEQPIEGFARVSRWRQKSLMTLSADGDGTRMQYELERVPSFLASSVLSPDFLKHEIQEQFTAIVGEMVKRKKEALHREEVHLPSRSTGPKPARDSSWPAAGLHDRPVPSLRI